jgi:DNA-binding Lrp family transcriptional regulator
MSLDRIDTEILRLLQNDARLSNKQIAAAVGLAPSSVHDRIKRLWADGVMIGLHAEIAPQAMGVGLEALLMIELAKHERATVDRFMDDIVEIPEVRSAHLITGRYDLVVHVVARDTRHLKDLALDRFTNRPGVTRIETSIIYETRTRYELPRLASTATGSHERREHSKTAK